MTLLHLSDTHGRHREMAELPYADLLVHSGDFTMAGSESEAVDFIQWLCDLPHRHKIFIAGNHDSCLLNATLDGLPDNMHYLCNEALSIDGISFYGAPMFVGMQDGDLAEIEHYAQIPERIDVLITHRPPLGILDSVGNGVRYGSATLLEKVKLVKPKLLLFGHVHGAYGKHEWNGTLFCNSGVTDWRYNLIYPPQMLEI